MGRLKGYRQVICFIYNDELYPLDKHGRHITEGMNTRATTKRKTKKEALEDKKKIFPTKPRNEATDTSEHLNETAYILQAHTNVIETLQANNEAIEAMQTLSEATEASQEEEEEYSLSNLFSDYFGSDEYDLPW